MPYISNLCVISKFKGPFSKFNCYYIDLRINNVIMALNNVSIYY